MNDSDVCTALLARLARVIDEVLKPLIPTGTPCALIDFPNHPNVGDSAIWLGETTWLAQRTAPIVYSCDTKTYSREMLEASLGDGIILIHGGGNLGDFWTHHQQLREQVIRDFPDRPIVQLPQTIYFLEQSNIEKVRRVFDGHPQLTILCRDQRSLELARREFAAAALLCPDMALALGPVVRAAAEHRVVWLSRTDEESQGLALPKDLDDVQVVDWIDEPATPLRDRNHQLTRELLQGPRNWQDILGPLTATYEPLAAMRFRRGCEMLSKGQVVITDRLHGHILCLLQGIPHVLFENLYGKIRGFYETWTRECPQARWADTHTAALTLARELARQQSPLSQGSA